jgi:hypothetical protein
MIGRVARWVVLGAVLTVGIVGRVRYFDWCMHDDAWISFRYARNLVRGDGLVMNPGERVEGVTNFLWTVISAPILAAGADPVRWTQLLGAALALGLIVAVWLFGERRLGGGWFALMAPALLAGNLAFVMESLSGLETMLFAALLFAAYTAFLAERRDPARPPGAWAAWCGAATVVRPEGALLFGVLAGWAAIGIARGEPASRLARAALVYAALVVPLVAFRLAYYGAPLPNTFYTKVGWTTEQLARGWRYTRYAFLFPLTLPLLAVAAAGPIVDAIARRRLSAVARRAPAPKAGSARFFVGRDREEAVAVALLLAAAWVLYVWGVGGDYEPTGRFHMPVLALVYLAFQEGLRSVVLATTGRARRAATVAALVAGVVFGLRSEQATLIVLERRGWPHARRAHHDELRAAGEWFRDHTRPGTRIALSSIGALAYYADRPVIDMMGLTDAHIGRRRMAAMGQGAAGHEKGDGDYVLSRRPDIILLDKGLLFPQKVPVEQVLSGARGVSETEIVRDPRLSDEYELVETNTRAGVLYWLQRREFTGTNRE